MEQVYSSLSKASNLSTSSRVFKFSKVPSKISPETSPLIEAGFKKADVELINGPIGIKLGGKSPSEIALSIISQLVSEKYKNKI